MPDPKERWRRKHFPKPGEKKPPGVAKDIKKKVEEIIVEKVKDRIEDKAADRAEKITRTFLDWLLGLLFRLLAKVRH